MSRSARRLELAREREMVVAASRNINNTASTMQAEAAELDGQTFIKPICAKTEAQHKRSLALLTRFLEELGEDPTLYLSTNKDAKPLTKGQWCRYAKWFASRSQGRVRSFAEQAESESMDPVRKNTVEHTVFKTVSALFRLTRQEHVDADMRRQIKAYISEVLTPELSLDTRMREKLMGTPMDLEKILAAAWEDDINWKQAEERLAFTLCLKVLIFTCCRPGEILRIDPYEDCLKWKDVELYFLTQDDGSLTIAGRVTIRLLKGLRDDLSETKSNVLHMDRENPLFCPIMDLLGLAQLQGVLKESAHDLLGQLSRPSRRPSGERVDIGLKDDMLEQPVFRHISRGQGGNVADGSPCEPAWLNERLLQTGHFAGFVGRHTCYVWRRMAANALNTAEVTSAQLKLQMGHGPNSKSFRAYMSRTALVDVQNLVLGKRQRKADIITVLRNTASTPSSRTVSAAGQRQVMALKSIRDLKTQRDEARRLLLLRYPDVSLKVALAQNIPEATEYAALKARRRTLVTRELKHRLEIENREGRKQRDQQWIHDRIHGENDRTADADDEDEDVDALSHGDDGDEDDDDDEEDDDDNEDDDDTLLREVADEEDNNSITNLSLDAMIDAILVSSSDEGSEVDSNIVSDSDDSDDEVLLVDEASGSASAVHPVNANDNNAAQDEDTEDEDSSRQPRIRRDDDNWQPHETLAHVDHPPAAKRSRKTYSLRQRR